MKGFFISFEGPEGSGKSTHAARLAERLRREGREVVQTREPGGTPTGEAIRHLLQHDAASAGLAPTTELLLFAASRAQLVADVIRPALARGACVVCDRFADSTTAYQGYGRGLDRAQILKLNALAVGDTMPDITILLDVDVPEALRRLRERNVKQRRSDDRFEREAAAFHERVRRGYLNLARRWPQRFRVVDSSGTIETVDAAVWQAVRGLGAVRPRGGRR